MTTENWRDDHIPEVLRLPRRKQIEAEWEVRRLQRIIDEAEGDLEYAVHDAAEAAAEYRRAFTAWKAAQPAAATQEAP